ncbi:MAG: acyl carrier protein [Anaerovibrio sp.]|uniref:acyl carrier protein n=1 Tax=Anaerovibrio sp. TaxID=1872532 RepID=UPI0025CE308E|nr:acyl carrier protein [Anaerovibrio sp.]MCR5175253.1 acyl carrier protein [Anaerovibrio sp.]
MERIPVYNKVFAEVLGIKIDDSTDLDKLVQKEIVAWDSLAHMSLVTALEKEFSIRMGIEDIKKFVSYRAGLEILEKYCGNAQ